MLAYLLWLHRAGAEVLLVARVITLGGTAAGRCNFGPSFRRAAAQRSGNDQRQNDSKDGAESDQQE